MIARTVSAAGGLIAALPVSATAAALPTFSGRAVSNPFGSVQVTIRVSGTRVVGLSATGPHHASYSRSLNSRALPRLRREALRAQSAHINGVSGATYTSNGFERSLCSALLKARLVTACGAPSTPLPGLMVNLHISVALQGIIESVDVAADTLVLRPTFGPQQGRFITIEVNSKTRFFGYANLSQVSPKDKVFLVADESKNPPLAEQIDDLTPRLPPGPSTGPGPPPPPPPAPNG